MGISRRNSFIAAVTAVAFAILVSVSATHLHVGADADEACALCAAFAGKLEGPVAKVAVPPRITVGYLESESQSQPQVRQAYLVILPPSCGPPLVA
jgi:hypothetical protein